VHGDRGQLEQILLEIDLPATDVIMPEMTGAAAGGESAPPPGGSHA